MLSAIGLIELTSIAKGYEVADTMLKTASVEIVFNRSICPGKFMVMVGGEVDAVNSSIQAGLEIGGQTVVDDLIIPNIHPDVFPAISGTNIIESPDALGIIETFSVASIIEAADAAVNAAVEAGVDYIKEKGILVNKVIIPQPRKEILRDKI